MLRVYPDYYKEFRCIAERCRHNCCIGWEIDIDSDTADFYKSLGGDFGTRLRENISHGDEPHFLLTEGERCPFLNGRNLCDIITTLGEEKLCTICNEHPRFHNTLPDRIESGLGMCCEEAARIILTQKNPVRLIYSEAQSDTHDEVILLRDKVIGMLQDRSLTLDERLHNALSYCPVPLPHSSPSQWAEFFLTLERLSDKWTERLLSVKDIPDADSDFHIHMKDRETEYEQLCVYLVYRHMANSPDTTEAAIRLVFAAVSCSLIRRMGELMYITTGDFTTEDQTELCRLFSSEIEYSDENPERIYDEIYSLLYEK